VVRAVLSPRYRGDRFFPCGRERVPTRSISWRPRRPPETHLLPFLAIAGIAVFLSVRFLPSVKFSSAICSTSSYCDNTPFVPLVRTSRFARRSFRALFIAALTFPRAGEPSSISSGLFSPPDLSATYRCLLHFPGL